MAASKNKKGKGKSKGSSGGASTKSHTKPPKTKSKEDDGSGNPSSDEKRSWSSSASGLAVAGIGVALALGCNRFSTRITDDGGSSGSVGNNAATTLSSMDMLAKVRRSRSFELTDNGNKTLSATADMPAGTVLMEIPRELMIWDLDAVRDEFVKTELSRTKLFGGKSSDTLSRRAALLSAYLALLRNDAVTPGKSFPAQASVAKALPSHDEYAAFHPVLADLNRMKSYLGEHSLSFLHLAHVRESLNREYTILAKGSEKFAKLVPREDYMACRLAVQSRAFQISNIPPSEVPEEEKEHYQQTIGIDFSSAVVSIEPVNDWMNNHVNNNVKVGGYDAVKRVGRAETVKDIPKGQELINSYGNFYDHVLFGQYGFIPTDGSGTSIASLFVHHDMDLMDELNETNPSLPHLETMAPYLHYDYGYPRCITREDHPESFEFKRLKLMYLQQIAIDSSRWVLPLPPRVSTDATPISTMSIPDDYRVPIFQPDVYEHLEENALGLSLPCRLITLTEEDLENGIELLNQDLGILKGASNPQQTPLLRLEQLQVSITWLTRTMHCMKTLASIQNQKYALTAHEQEQYIMTLIKLGNTNTLEWNAAHVKLEEMQSQEALENWASHFFDSLVDMYEGDPYELFVREEPCPEIYTAELVRN